MTKPPERITLKKIGSQILEQFNLERGLGYTIKHFLLRPKRAVEEFLYEDREIYMKPFNFLLFTTAITTFLMLQFVVKDQNIMDFINSPQWAKIPELLKPGLKLIAIGFRKYFNLVYLSSLPMVSLSSYWVFKKKYPYNLAEHLIINIYIFSIQSLLYIINIAFLAAKSHSFLSALPSLLLVFYFVYAYRQIFNLTIPRAILSALVVYLIAQLLNIVALAFILGIGILVA